MPDFIQTLKCSVPTRFQKVAITDELGNEKIIKYPVYEIIVDESRQSGYVLNPGNKRKVIKPLGW